MEYYEYFNDQIRKILDSKVVDSIVLYPFGKLGMLFKEILNWRYGVEEAFICDEKLSAKNMHIKPLKYLSEIDTSKFKVVITSDNISCYDEIRKNLRQYVNEENIIDLFPCKPLLSDSPRIASLELVSREIYNRKIQGAVAEAGVYRGCFAAYINRFFRDRKLFLFDTFEGFPTKDINEDKAKGYTLRNAGHFNDTSVDSVLKNLPYVENAVIKKGIFPDTTAGINEQFCFVSLDMDLYQPIKSGLEFFYPRLQGGGYIFVHDCCIGHVNYKGARIALLEFIEKEKIGYVMLPDNSTAVITKGLL